MPVLELMPVIWQHAGFSWEVALAPSSGAAGLTLTPSSGAAELPPVAPSSGAAEVTPTFAPSSGAAGLAPTFTPSSGGAGLWVAPAMGGMELTGGLGLPADTTGAGDPPIMFPAIVRPSSDI